MALDPGLVGRSYPPSAVYEVGRAKIAEFARAIGAEDPVHRDQEAARAAGHPDVIAPPTFAIVLTLEAANVVLDDPDVSLDYSRVVHGEQRFTHHRPIRAGDRLVARTTIETVRHVAGNDMLTTRVDLATDEGEPVCTATSMLVARGAERPAGANGDRA
jgi:acyl dehydratase